MLLLWGLQLLSAESMVGTAAPKFMLKNINNQYIALRSFIDSSQNAETQFVLLNFWATYCQPCKKEIPELEALVGSLPEKIKLLLVSIDTVQLEVVKKYAEENKYSSEILIDRYQVAAEKFHVTDVPSLFLIDKKGIILYEYKGYSAHTVQEIKKLFIKPDNTMKKNKLKKAKK